MSHHISTIWYYVEQKSSNVLLENNRPVPIHKPVCSIIGIYNPITGGGFIAVWIPPSDEEMQEPYDWQIVVST